MKPKDWIIVSVIILVTFSVFANIVTNNFIYEDKTKIVDNPFIKDFRWFGKIFSGEYTKYFAEKDYQPVVTISYFLNYAYAKLDTREWHILNIFLHTFNGILIYILARYLLFNALPALFIALIFVVHPIQSETLNVMSFRNELLLSIFYLVSLILYLKSKNDKKKLFLVGSLVSYVLAIFCDRLALTLPFVVLWYEYCRETRDGKREMGEGRRYELLFYFGIMIVYLLIEVIFTGSYKSVFQNRDWLEMILTGPILLVKYLGLLVLPWNIRFDYNLLPLQHFTISNIIYLIIMVLLIIWGILINNYIKLYIGILIITLLPNCWTLYGFANHHLYLPMLGFAIILVTLFEMVITQIRLTIKYVVLIIIILSLGGYTIVRNRDWNNEFTRWSRVSKFSPSSVKAHLRLGQHYFTLSKSDNKYLSEIGIKTEDNTNLVNKSMQEYDQAFKYYPQVEGDSILSAQLGSELYNSLALVFYYLREYDKSILSAQNSVLLNPNYAEAYLSLGLNYLVIKDTQTAVSYWDKAIAISPVKTVQLETEIAELYYQKDYTNTRILGEYLIRYPQCSPKSYAFLAAAYFQQNSYPAAYLYGKKAVELDSVNVLDEFPWLQALYYLEEGRKHYRAKEYKQAIACYREAIYTNPRFISAIKELGVVYYSQKMYTQAIKEFEKVLLIQPGNLEIMEGLGLSYLADNNADQSIFWFEQVLKIKGNSLKSFLGLANAYNMKKEKSKAMMYLNKVKQLDTVDAYKKDVEALSKLLK